jgi:hypothetical protein
MFSFLRRKKLDIGSRQMYRSQKRHMPLFWQADVQEPKLSHAAVPTVSTEMI